eukprot:578807-Amphidinium_carterae.1
MSASDDSLSSSCVCPGSALHCNSHLVSAVRRQEESIGGCCIAVGRMSGVSKPSGAAIAANNTVRSGEILQEALQSKLKIAIQNFPSKAVQLWQHCNDLGITDNNYMMPEVPALISKEKSAHLKRQQSARELREQQKVAAKVAAEASGAVEPCPVKYKTINDFTAPVLKA